MKKFIYLIILLSNTSYACDICGCNNGGSFFGMLPQSHMQFMGMRYRIKNYDSHLSSQVLKTTEHFETTELWGRFYPVKRTQLMFFAPINFNTQTRLYDAAKNSIQGLGDVSVLVHYNLLNTFTDTTKIRRVDHNLLIGAGIKAPTGKFKYDMYNVEEVANANFQLGTGSWDFPLNVIYTLKYKQSGLNVNGTYKINGTNQNGYHFANRSNVSFTAFHSFNIGNATVMPIVGMYGEATSQDKVDKIKNVNTGGWLAAVSLGTEAYLGKNAIGFNTQIPVAQQLSNGELALKNAFNFHITRMF